MPLLPLGACTQLFPRDHTERALPKPQPLPPAPPSSPSPAPGILVPFKPLLQPPASGLVFGLPAPYSGPGTAFLRDEVSAPCGRAGRCPAKYRRQVRPARDRIWRLRGWGAQTSVPSRHPA